MRIGKPLAMLVGLMTIWPIGFMFFVVATTIPQMLRGVDHEQGPQLYEHLASSVSGLTVFWMLLLVFYLIHLFRSPLPARHARISWVVSFLVFGPLAELVYWWRYIWPHKSASALSV